MILKYGTDMKKDIIKLSQGWEAEAFYTNHDSDRAKTIINTILNELLTYIDDGCELEEEK